MVKKKNKKRSRKAFGKYGAYIGAGVYGGLRARMSNYLRPYTIKIPLGDISDEVGMIGACYLFKRFLGRKVPLVTQIANAGMLIESARIGESVATGSIMGGSSSSGGSFR